MVFIFKRLFNRNKEHRGKEHIFCEISIEGKDEWVRGMISHINLKNSFVEIFIFSEHLKNSFNENEKVNIKLIKDNLEYSFGGIVDKKDLSVFDRALVIKINDTKVIQNLRKSERFSYSCSMSVKQDPIGSSFGILKNLSSEGALFTTESDFDSSKELLVEISAFPGKSINFHATMIRKTINEGKINYAVKIIDIDSSSKELLDELIVLLSMQKNIISKEYKEFNKAKLEATMLQSRLKI